MAHYAFLDENNVVTEVITGRDEWEIVQGVSDWESHYGEIRGQKCVRTSFNGTIRKQYAIIGGTYNEDADVFVSPQPYTSWVLDENFDWQPPIPKPVFLDYEKAQWSEEEQNWIVE